MTLEIWFWKSRKSLPNLDNLQSIGELSLRLTLEPVRCATKRGEFRVTLAEWLRFTLFKTGGISRIQNAIFYIRFASASFWKPTTVFLLFPALLHFAPKHYGVSKRCHDFWSAGRQRQDISTSHIRQVLMSTRNSGPRLEPVPFSWHSTAEGHHAALDDDGAALRDSLYPEEASPFDHDSQPPGDDAWIAQEQAQDTFASEPFWHALTVEVPQASLDSGEIYKIQLQGDSRRLGILGSIPNFSRPFRSLSSARGRDDTHPEPQVVKEKPKSQESTRNTPLAAQKWESLAVHSDSEVQALDHFRKHISSSTSDTSVTLQGHIENHHSLMQPCGQPPPEPTRSSGSSAIPNDCPDDFFPNGPSNLTHPSSPDNPESPPPPEPPPGEERPHNSASGTLNKLKGHFRASHNKTSSRNTNISSTHSQPQTTDKIQNPENRSTSSWSTTLKQALNYLPRRQKAQTNHERIPRDRHVDTNHSNWRSPTKESHTGSALRDQSPSIRSKALTRETESSTSKPPTSILSNASSSFEKPRLPLKVATTPLTGVKEFHCTFCLFECGNKTDWLKHEQRFHLEDLENFSRPSKPKDAQRDEISSSDPRWSTGKSSRRLLTKSQPQSSSSSSHSQPSSQSTRGSIYSSQRNEPQAAANIFWNCGFCDELLRSWEDRQTHLAEHFSNGQTMRMWDPMKSPFPWRKGSARTVDAPPYWDLPSLLTLQRPTLQDSINQIGTSPGQRAKTAEPCKDCHVPHPSLDHYDLWHQPRSTYTCPQITDYTNLADFFDEDEDETGELVVDWCNACDERFDRPHYLDREVRMQHLWDFHGFGDCVGWHDCMDKDQFVLHLANAHAVNIDNIKGLLRRCTGVGDAPALMVMGSGGSWDERRSCA
ncbi:hypothetical protein EMPG_16349 [Blastomyces silverae]|uniref:C2H2-type domain-containing protein n=1 Tax=Blastomyces silverae TaxID=2060906 RepID=A0A0H1BB17_9EURO|nr:hypothetical protein EMPG_16349 [Blastomyces silverae]